MKNLTRLVFLTTLFLLPASSFADIITFGPISDQGDVPPDYDGFNWSYPAWTVFSNVSYAAAYGNTYGAPSGAAAGGGGFEGPGNTISSDSQFTFEGADFTSFAIDDSLWCCGGTEITVNGYDAEGQLVGTVSMNLSPSSYNFLSADLQNVTMLQFIGSSPGNPNDSYNDWLMDDFTYTTTNSDSTSTPEPPLVVPLTLILLVVAFFTRRANCRPVAPYEMSDLSNS